MIESTRPKLNRFKYAAMLLGTAAVVAVPSIGLAATAAAADEWDIGAYDECIKNHPNAPIVCCVSTGGEWSGDNETGKCVAPPANPASSQPQGLNRGLRSTPPTAINPAP
jgi:hypothetical protein